MFVKTHRGMLPLSRIALYKSLRDHVEITDVTDMVHRVDHASWSSAMNDQVQTAWAASPGTYVCEVGGDADFTVYKQVVLGWCLNPEGIVYPITDQGVNNGEQNSQTILHPTGEVETLDQFWSSFDDWTESARAKFNGAKRSPE